MKIPFDIKFRPQIESGEYKVETRDGRKARIIHWDLNCTSPIVAVMDEHIDLPGEIVDVFSVSGMAFDDLESPSDLFIVTPEPELSEFEKRIRFIIDEVVDGRYNTNNIEDVKGIAKGLLELARDQFIKDGYVIEKKAFHEAVEKVAPDVMKEVSENVDKTNEELTEFERELESFYNHHLQVCTYDNQGTVEDSLHDGASKLLALARKELCDQIVDHTKEAYENGRADALKDLPMWKKIRDNGCIDADGGTYTDCLCLLKRGWYQVVTSGTKVGRESRYLSIRDLEKLPGFKEDEK
jgi:hypothetical protein